MRSRIIPAVAVLATLSACSGTTAAGQSNGSTPAPPAPTSSTGSSSSGPAPDPQRKPGFAVEQITGGLEHGWLMGRSEQLIGHFQQLTREALGD